MLKSMAVTMRVPVHKKSSSRSLTLSLQQGHKSGRFLKFPYIETTISQNEELQKSQTWRQ